MKNTLTKIMAAIMLVAFSWGGICGLVKLITLCFNWPFTLKIGTGVWLITILLRITFNFNRSKK